MRVFYTKSGEWYVLKYVLRKTYGGVWDDNYD